MCRLVSISGSKELTAWLSELLDSGHAGVRLYYFGVDLKEISAQRELRPPF